MNYLWKANHSQISFYIAHTQRYFNHVFTMVFTITNLDSRESGFYGMQNPDLWAFKTTTHYPHLTTSAIILVFFLFWWWRNLVTCLLIKTIHEATQALSCNTIQIIFRTRNEGRWCKVDYDLWLLNVPLDFVFTPNQSHNLLFFDSVILT